MKVTLVRENHAFWASEYITSIYEDKDKAGNCYVTLCAMINNELPENFTKSIYKKDFDFLIVEGCTCDGNCACHKEENNEQSDIDDWDSK